MYNFSFICRASKIDKKGFAPIELSIIINGTRTYVILPMKYEPTLFNKMMTSKKNNEVLEYTSSVRTKLNKCIAEMTANNIPSQHTVLKNISRTEELFEYADTSIDARKEVLRHLLDTNELSFNSVLQAVNFIAIMLGKEKIQDIIKTEIDKVISETHKVGNDNKGHIPC